MAFINGRSQRTALLLLAAAAQLEHPKFVVEAQRLGYLVPDDVAERYAELDKELADADAEREGTKAPKEPKAPKQTDEQRLAAEADAEVKPAKKAAPRKTTAAKKTAAKKTAARKTAAAAEKE